MVDSLKGARVLLGVCGGIAAYKACELCRLLIKDGVDVHVIMTDAATRFVTPLTFETLSLHRVGCSLWDKVSADRIEHTEIARDADLIVVAPATANTVGRIRGGLADDLLSTVVMASETPVLLFPSMNVTMFENPIVQGNLAALTARGRYEVVDPDDGELACQVVGRGRLPEPAVMRAFIRRALRARRADVARAGAPSASAQTDAAARSQGDARAEVADLRGQRVLVSAGATRAPIDDVRFITNPSSGRMGFAIAEACWERGADVTLVTGPTLLPTPTGVLRLDVETVAEMRAALSAQFAAPAGSPPDLMFMAAAVGDFELERPFPGKLKKAKHLDGLDLRLRRGPDLLSELSAENSETCFVGFAAEVADHEQNAQGKLRSKKLDYLFMNPVGAPGVGFASTENQGVLYPASGRREPLALQSKQDLAGVLVDRVSAPGQAADQVAVNQAASPGSRSPEGL